MKTYILYDRENSGKLWIMSGENAVDAAQKIITKIGGNEDVNRFSVDCNGLNLEDEPFCLSKLWPYFTNKLV